MIFVALRTVPGLNAREVWRAHALRVKREREAVAWTLTRYEKPSIPCSVQLIRSAPSRGLDDDNLSGALKGVRDAVATWLGIDDRHRAQVAYFYDQRTGPWGVEIRFGAPIVGAQFELLERQPDERLPF